MCGSHAKQGLPTIGHNAMGSGNLKYQKGEITTYNSVIEPIPYSYFKIQWFPFFPATSQSVLYSCTGDDSIKYKHR